MLLLHVPLDCVENHNRIAIQDGTTDTAEIADLLVVKDGLVAGLEIAPRLAVLARDGQPQLPDHVGQLLVGVEAGHSAGGALVLLPFGGAPQGCQMAKFDPFLGLRPPTWR